MEVEFLVVEADEGGEVAMVEIVLVASVEVESPADEGDEGVEVAMLEIELIASMEVGLPVGKVNEGGKVAMLMLLINDAHPTPPLSRTLLTFPLSIIVTRQSYLIGFP